MLSIQPLILQYLPLLLILVVAVPFLWLRLRAFSDDWRYQKKITLAICITGFALFIGLRVALDFYYPGDTVLYLTHALSFFALFNFLCFYLIKLPTFMQLFVHLLLILYFDLVLSGAWVAEQALFPDWAVQFPGLVQSLSVVVLICLTWGLALRFMNEVLTPLMLGVKTAAWRALWLLPTSLFICYAPAALLLDQSFPVFVPLLLRLFGFGATLFLISMVLSALEQVAEDAKEQEHTQMMKSLLAGQEEQTKLLTSCMIDIKSAKQDYKLNLLHINNLVNQQAYSKLASFLTYGASPPMDTEIPFCDIPAADSLVRYYMRACEKLSIRLTTRLSITRSNFPLEGDLCILLSNCLANAFEACQHSDQDGKFIEIRARKTGEHILIVAENSYSSYTVLHDPTRLYTKGRRWEGEGIGLACMQALATKYHGAVKIETPGGGVMRTSVSLTIPPFVPITEPEEIPPSPMEQAAPEVEMPHPEEPTASVAHALSEYMKNT